MRSSLGVAKDTIKVRKAIIGSGAGLSGLRRVLRPFSESEGGAHYPFHDVRGDRSVGRGASEPVKGNPDPSSERQTRGGSQDAPDQAGVAVGVLPTPSALGHVDNRLSCKSRPWMHLWLRTWHGLSDSSGGTPRSLKGWSKILFIKGGALLANKGASWPGDI
jgi:hypothetical protein